MLTEMHGKGGCLCQSAKEGNLRCPLIVRASSEDVVTGHLMQALRILSPHWWLPDLLNEALGCPRFRRQIFRHLRIGVWENKPCYPREFLPWDEGSTQVDTIISWENPPTTVYIEMKYGSDLSAGTARNDGSHGYPADQLIRNARVGLLETGWFQTDRLFHIPPRDFVLLLISPWKGNPLVKHYRDTQHLLAAIPQNDRLPNLPRTPFLGELGYNDVVRILRRRRAGSPERSGN